MSLRDEVERIVLKELRDLLDDDDYSDVPSTSVNPQAQLRDVDSNDVATILVVRDRVVDELGITVDEEAIENLPQQATVQDLVNALLPKEASEPR